MADSYNKKERNKKKELKKKEKFSRKEARKSEEKSSSLESMMAYVDENGNIVNSPPQKKSKEIDASKIVIGVPESISEPADVQKKGKVQFFNSSKGYGFIKEVDSDESRFFHINNTLVDVDEGDEVTYELEKGPKGLVAVRIQKSIQ